jgi:uncharacterized protein YjbI with pentapeptide repeats
VLERAQAARTVFTGCDLRGAKAGQACFFQALFGAARLARADFSSADLRASWWERCDATAACFRDAQLGNADFAYAVLDLADFSHAQAVGIGLHAARCDGTRWDHANRRQARLTDLERLSAETLQAPAEAAG